MNYEYHYNTSNLSKLQDSSTNATNQLQSHASLHNLKVPISKVDIRILITTMNFRTIVGTSR